MRLLLLLLLVCGGFSTPCSIVYAAAATPKIHCHLNRDQFRAGEKIWISIYLAEARSLQLLRLTHPVYAQLHAPQGQIVAEEILYSQNGRGFGYISIPEGVGGGLYRLRLYTRDNLTNGGICERTVVIYNSWENQIASLKKTALQTPLPQSLCIEAKPDKSVYGPRQKATVRIKVTDTKDRSVQGAFSMSVSDSTLLAPAGHNSILLFMRPDPPSGDFTLPEQAEGLTLEGVVLNQKTNKPIKNASVILAIKDTTRTFSQTAVSDKQGRFRFAGLYMDGNAQIGWQVGAGNGRPLRQATIEWKAFPPHTHITALRPEDQGFMAIPSNPSAINASVDGDDPDDFSKGAVFLKEIEIKGKGIAQRGFIPPPGVQRLHSEADFAMDFDETSPRFTSIKDMFYFLPGVMVIQMVGDAGPCGFNLRVRGFSSNRNNNPIFLLDGIPVEQDAICTINPNEVMRIEVLSGANAAMYGIGAGNGVIAIYMRTIDMRKRSAEEVSSKLTYRVVQGYQPDLAFFSPDYSKKNDRSQGEDMRSTLYWNPEIVVNRNGEAEVSFYTGDRKGVFKIVVEGMTHGSAARGEALIVVK